MIAKWRLIFSLNWFMHPLLIAFFSGLVSTQITQLCEQSRGPDVQASIDEAIAMAENAVSCYHEPSIRVAALWFALIRDRAWYPFALESLQRVANWRYNPPKILVYCGDGHISKAADGKWYDYTNPSNSPVPILGGFKPCAEVPTWNAYVLRAQHTPMVVLCPAAFGHRYQIGEVSRHTLQLNVPIDNTMTVSGMILHEFLHIANPLVIDQSFSPTLADIQNNGIAPGMYGAYGWAYCVHLVARMGGQSAVYNADSLRLVAQGLFFTNTDFAYGVGTPLTHTLAVPLQSDCTLLVPLQPDWQLVGDNPLLGKRNLMRRRLVQGPVDLSRLV